jgi:hypothetical protein
MKTNYWFNQNLLLSHSRIATAGTFILVLLVVITLTRPSLAAPAQTYHGTLTGGSFFCNGDAVSGPAVTGTWSLSIDPMTPAQLTLNVFYDDRHHLAWGYNALILDPSQSGGGLYVFSGFGPIATATLDTRGTPITFSWQVDLSEVGINCNPDDNSYNLLTFSGVASR